jgi:Tfp pilus assembly protein PilX
MKSRRSRKPSARSQRGISLLVVTVLMLGIMLMALTAFYVSKNEYRLVGNIQASELAFARAESADEAARAWINSSGNSKSGAFEIYSPASSSHLYPTGQLNALGYTPAKMTWSNSNSTVAGEGRYLIELLGRNIHKPGDSIAIQQASTSCTAVDLFRILSKADAGQSGSRIIETIEAVDGC